MKEQILQLRAEGKSYSDIQKLLGCSKGTIGYYCNVQSKGKTLRRRLINTKKNLKELKEKHGGKCNRCGYDRCLDALDFHHRDPTTKDQAYNSMSAILRTCSIQKAHAEAEKCELICTNCHREHHYIPF